MPPAPRQPQREGSSAVPTRPSTRERILAYFQENRVASVQALSRAWGLTRADIRYHFNSLVDEGLVELIPRDANQPARRGRPEQRYRLAAASAPNNFPGLCSALLDALLTHLPADEREPALRRLAGQLAGGFSGAANPTQRLTQACAHLSQYHYRARWEAYASGPRILLRNCPYSRILPAHPELCDLDRFLLEHMLQIPLVQTVHIQSSEQKPGACVFIIQAES